MSHLGSSLGNSRLRDIRPYREVSKNSCAYEVPKDFNGILGTTTHLDSAPCLLEQRLLAHHICRIFAFRGHSENLPQLL